MLLPGLQARPSPANAPSPHVESIAPPRCSLIRLAFPGYFSPQRNVHLI
jgi:hypothetical protein